MNKKIVIISLLAVFMLIAIAFTSTVTSDTLKPVRKESPLFGIRTKLAIREKIEDFMKTRFVGEQVFFLPFQWLRNHVIKSVSPTGCDTCVSPFVTCGQTKCVPLCTLFKDEETYNCCRLN